MIRTTVAAQRTMGQTMMNAVPPMPTWPSIPFPIDGPNTISAEAAPPMTSVASMSGNAYSRLATNVRSTGTS